MIFKKQFSFIFIFCFLFSFSQEGKVIDSLKLEIEKNKDDKFEDYKNICTEYFKINDLSNLKNYAILTLEYANKKQNDSYIASAKNIEAEIYILSKDFDKAKIILEDALKHASKVNDYYNMGITNLKFQKICFKQQDFKGSYNFSKKAVSILKKADKSEKNIEIINTSELSMINDLIALSSFDLAKKEINNFKLKKNNLTSLQLRNLLTKEASLLGHLKEYKNSILIYKKILSLNYNEKDPKEIGQNVVASFQIASYYLELGDINNAKEYLRIALSYKEKTNSLDKVIEPYIADLKSKIALKEGDINLAKKHTDSAYTLSIKNKDNYAKAGILNLKGVIEHKLNKKNDLLGKSVDLFKSIGTKNEQLDALEDLVKYSINIKDSISSNKSFDDYIKLNKEVFNENLAKSISFYEIKFQTAEKEAKIKTQQLQIQKEKANKNFALAGIVFISLLTIGGFWLYRIKQNQKEINNQNTLLTLQQNLNAMQLDNLNKQLDPHEVKNILANISPEIQRNAPDAYNKMTKLLNLTRASLSSNSITDSIENQLQQIDDYLSLEKTVLPVSLNYTINNTIDTSKQIPRLLLKNLVENSIKHGIKNKKEGGEINIDLTEINNKIKITVDDTGIGRKQAISLDSGIGTSTYINLFETLNKTNTQKASFNIIDKEQGTTVEIIIPNNYIYS